MNNKQITAITRLTGQIAACLDSVHFNVEQFEGGEVMVTASNLGNISAHRDSDFVLAIVGTRGGVEVRNGNATVRQLLSH